MSTQVIAPLPPSNVSVVSDQIPPETREEQARIVTDADPWSDSRAKDLAWKDTQRAVTYRNQAYDKAFRRSDDVFMAMTVKKTWEGTRKPRASVPVWLAVSQIEALIPHRLGALFSDDYPFECMPQPGTSLQQAIAVRDLLRSQMDNLNPDVIGMTLREVMRRSIKSGLIYGAGPIEFGWQFKLMERAVYKREAYPKRVMLPHPLTGEPVSVPTGEIGYRVVRDTKTYNISAPKVKNVSIWDFYLDPNCPSANPQEAQYAAVQELLPINYLKQICLPEFGFKLPKDDKQWTELAHTKGSTQADVSAGWAEMDRGNLYRREFDQSSDPAQARIRVTRYFQRNRHVWLFGGSGDFLAYNEPNELGVLPFLNSPYVDVPGRFYQLSLCDLVESDQKLIQQILEARADELSLSIHSPMIFVGGSPRAQSQRKLGPGRTYEVPDKDSIPVRMEMGNVTQQAFIEVQAAEQRVQKTTGVTDLATLGAPAAGGNSANRTATGVNTQAAASGTRIQYQVENDEDQSFGPLLQMLLLLNQKFLDPEQSIVITGQDGQDQSIDPLDVLNASVRFKVKASDKLRMRRAFAQGMAPFLQFVEGIAQQLAQIGKTPNWDLISQVVADTYGMAKSDLIVDMTPQQMQVMQMQTMGPILAKGEQEKTRLQAHADMQEDKSETELLKVMYHHPQMMQAMLRMLGQKDEAPPSQSINFKDMPPSGKVQMAQAAGITISASEAKAQDQAMKPKPQLTAGGK